MRLSLKMNPIKCITLLGPGILIAATGVGAGDLLTASLGGSALGFTILWAALAGAILKGCLNEGIARWQMATETTLLEGWMNHLGSWIRWFFLIYLLFWSFFTGGALISACGVAGSSLLPLTSDPFMSRIIWGVIHSVAGLLLIWIGGYRLFEKMMAFCIAVMFVTVIATAVMIQPDWSQVFHGILIPSIPAGGLGWTLGILGGVGGTLTLMSYGYWIHEKERRGVSGLKMCRIDLTVGYTMTALFGLAMIIIGSHIKITGSGLQIAVLLAEQLEMMIGPFGRFLFLLGFWGAVFSSLLGVWQSVPYLFTDFYLMRRPSANYNNAKNFTTTRPYRFYLIAISMIPIPLLWISVKKVQLIYAVFGSFFMPLLALTLLLLNNRKKWVGESFQNGWKMNTFLFITLIFFLTIGLTKLFDL